MDFNPWGEKTDPLLFEWEDLVSEKFPEDLQYKFIPNNHEIRDAGLGKYKVPVVR